MVQHLLDLLEFLNKAYDEYQVNIINIISNGFTRTVVDSALNSGYIEKLKGDYYQITPKGYQYLKLMGRITKKPELNKSRNSKIKDKWLRPIAIGVILLVIGMIINYVILPVFTPSYNEDNFIPKIELNGYEEVIFSPSDGYSSSYLTNIKINYDITTKHSTEVTFMQKDFKINPGALDYLDEENQKNNFSVKLVEKIIDIETEHEKNEIELEFILNDFWIRWLYTEIDTDIILGILIFEVNLYDRLTEKTNITQYTTTVKWINTEDFI